MITIIKKGGWSEAEAQREAKKRGMNIIMINGDSLILGKGR